MVYPWISCRSLRERVIQRQENSYLNCPADITKLFARHNREPGSDPVMGQSLWAAFRRLHSAGSPGAERQVAHGRSCDFDPRQKQWLWRAIDAKGDVLDILVQTHRNAKAAKRFFQRLMTLFSEPRVVIPPLVTLHSQCTAGQWINYAAISNR